MQRPSLGTLLLGAFLAVPSQTVFAGQAEQSVTCNESKEPILLNYGVHTVDCGITPSTDLDRFMFDASAGDQVRIIVDGLSNYFDPRIELRAPDGTVLRDQYCNGGSYYSCTVTVDETLSTEGTYQIAVSDNGADESGNYNISLQCLFGSCPDSVPTWPQCNVELDSVLYLPGDVVAATELRLRRLSALGP